MGFLTTTKTHPCVLCGDISGDCRTNGSGLILCHKNIEREKIKGFRFSKVSSNGVWGVWAQIDDDPQAEKRRLEIEAKRQEDRHRLEAKLARGLSIAERDAWLRLLSNYLGLHSDHRSQLQDRGLSENAINSGLFFTVERKAKVPVSVPLQLPGITLENGQKYLNSFSRGYACLAFDPHGRATGWQLRKERGKNNKYLWAKSEQSSHLKNGELPITVVGPTSSTVWLCEGLLKPFVASHRLGLRIIGAAGGAFGSSETQLKTYLGGARKIIIAPDAGDLLNPHVLQRWETVINLFPWKYDVSFAWWGQVEKTSPDLDELNDLNSINFLSLPEWRRLVEFHVS